MKKIVILLGLLVTILAGGTYYITTTNQAVIEKPILQSINTDVLTKMITEKEDMVIVDLREPELFQAGRVPDAINIPFAEIQSKFTILPKDKKIVFVCHTGRMGTESGRLLLENGYSQVFNMEGGMAKWNGELEK